MGSPPVLVVIPVEPWLWLSGNPPTPSIYISGGWPNTPNFNFLPLTPTPPIIFSSFLFEGGGGSHHHFFVDYPFNAIVLAALEHQDDQNGQFNQVIIELFQSSTKCCLIFIDCLNFCNLLPCSLFIGVGPLSQAHKEKVINLALMNWSFGSDIRLESWNLLNMSGTTFILGFYSFCIVIVGSRYPCDQPWDHHWCWKGEQPS